ncbi:MAG: TIGR02147 family protein, partial [Proteobacteria bacterium]
MYSLIANKDDNLVTMMEPSVFKFESYKDFLRNWIASRPRKGHGELKRLATALNVHSTLMSQVVNGQRDPSLEQAAELASVIGLSARERRFFLAQVQFAKAGSKKLRDVFSEELQFLREQELDVASKFKVKSELNEDAKSYFYSDWTYSAIRLITDLNSVSSERQIADALNLPIGLVKDRLEFLVANGLCLKTGSKYKLGPAITHLPRSSHLVGQHHRNWRMRSLDRVPT